MHQTVADTSFHEALLRTFPDGVFWLTPVCTDDNTVIDFQINFSNQKADKIISHSSGSITHLRMLRDDLFVNGTSEGFKQFLNVYKTGQPNEFYLTGVSSAGSIKMRVSKFGDGVLGVVTEQTNIVSAIEQQRALLDNILKYSPSGIAITEAIRDKEGIVCNWKTILTNEAAERFTGFKKELLLSKTMVDMAPEIVNAEMMKAAVATLDTGVPFMEHFYSAATERWLEVSVARMDENRLLILLTDITENKKSQLQMQQAGERLQAVFNASQSGMFTFKPEYNNDEEIIDFRFVITNIRFAGYVGQVPQTLENALGSTWFPGYLTNGVFDMYKHTFISGETQRKEVHYNVDGHDLYLDLMSTKVGDEVLITFTDFTPLKNAQLQLEKNIEELRRSNANLEEFAYAASHDIKEPIRKVHFFADRLRGLLKDRLTGQEEMLFTRMDVATDRMISLIEDLLDYSHVSRGAALDEDIDLGESVRTVLSDLELAIQEKGALIYVDDLPLIKGNSRQLQQLFQNLISNALKYTGPGVIPEIRITAALTSEQKNSDYYQINITDNGIGFEQKDAERIFNVFQRLHGNAEFRGTGVGLSIVRKVVENHNGYITAQSTPGKGSTFSMYIPVN